MPGGDVVRARTNIESGDVVYVDPPDDLSEGGAELWHALHPDLIATKVFRVSDSILLSELVESLAMAREFRQEVRLAQRRYEEIRPEDFENRKDYWHALELADGQIKRARTGYRQMMQTAMSIAGEFGISPVARLRLGIMVRQGVKLTDLFGDGDADPT